MFFNSFNKIQMVSENKNINENNELYFSINKKEEIIENKESANISSKAISEWYLEIPKFNLIAEIKEGTDEETLNQYIGHFTNTGITNQNICLAAHNRGYEKNYFSNIHELNIGDEVNYYYKDQKYIFIVNENFVIEDTNLQVLENTNKDEITLITCVKDKPNLRRCIKCIKK